MMEGKYIKKMRMNIKENKDDISILLIPLSIYILFFKYKIRKIKLIN